MSKALSAEQLESANRVAQLLRDNPTGYRLLANLGAAWRSAHGDPTQGQALVIAHLVSQKVAEAKQLAYLGVSLRSKKAPGAAAFGALVTGATVWTDRFCSAYFRVPNYPPQFFRAGTHPPDTTIPKLDVPRYAKLLADTQGIQHGAITVVQQLETHLANKYPDDPPADESEVDDQLSVAPDHVLDFRDGLAMASSVLRFMLTAPD